MRAGSQTELYTRQCALDVSAKDLAVMGATLADGGINPAHRTARGRSAEICHYALSVMATAGMYETSGDWLYDVGVPGKSGIGGGIRHGVASLLERFLGGRQLQTGKVDPRLSFKDGVTVEVTRRRGRIA